MGQQGDTNSASVVSVKPEIVKELLKVSKVN